jgi:tetratricopeptide (TPR) repeat protein
MRWVRRAATNVLLVVLVFQPAHALGQGDWAITRDRATTPIKVPRAARPTSRAARPSPTTRSADPIERAYRALLVDPDDDFALQRLRELWLARHGSLEGLAKRLEEERVLDPARVEPVLAQAEILALLERKEEALRVLSEVGGDDPRVALLQARMLESVGRKEQARNLYEILRKERRDPSLRRTAIEALAGFELDVGNTAQARALYEELGQADGESPLVGLASALSARGAHAQAARLLRELTDKPRGDPRIRARLARDAGTAFLAAGDPNAAIEMLQRALAASATPSERAGIYDSLIEAHRRSDRLLELAEQLEADRRGGAAAASRAASLWDELSDEAKAVAAYRRALALAPRDLDLRRGLSQLYLRSGKLDESIAEQQALVKLAPDDPASVVGLAKLLKEVGRSGDAQQVLDAAAARAPRSVALHRALAELYAQWADSTRAQAELTLLARLDPDDPVHLVALGGERFERGDREGALAVWGRLLERPSIRPAEAEAELAMVLADHDLLELALPHALKASALEPNNPQRIRDVAILLERAARLEEAEQRFRQLAVAGEADEILQREARQHLVGIWARSGSLRRHVIDLEESLHRNPKDVNAAKLLAEAYARDGSTTARRDEQRVLERLVLLDPKDAETLRALERACTRRGDITRALEVLEKLVVADPLHAAATLRRGVELALSSYRDDDALRFAQRSVELAPRDAKAHKLLGDLQRRRTKIDLALASYERALALDAKSFDTALAVAQLRIARGELDLAQERLLGVIEGAPDDELVRRAASSLLELAVSDERMREIEPRLLALAVGRPQRPLFRRLLVDGYGAWLGRTATTSGSQTSEQRARLALVGRRALKPLLEALADSDPSQRQVALSLLGRLGNRGAAAPLMTVAENAPHTRERAEALLAVGELGAPESATRLRTLLTTVEGRLRPLSVWALVRCAGAAARSDLTDLAGDSDASVRTLAVLGLGLVGAQADVSSLRVLAAERNPNVRAAAIWALAQHGDRSTLENAVRDVSPNWQVALSLSDDEEQLAPLVFDANEQRRSWALALLAAGEKGSQPVLAPPSWPFDPRTYVISLVTPPPASLHSTSDARLAALERASVRGLGGSPEAARGVLDALNAVGPRAPLTILAGCPDRFLGRPALVTALSGLAIRASGDLRRHSLALLVRAGASHDPVVSSVLDEGAPADRRAVLDAMPLAPTLSPVVRTKLVELALHAPDWPTRRRAVRALAGREQQLASLVAHERFAIVREAANELPSAPDARCTVMRTDSVN